MAVTAACDSPVDINAFEPHLQTMACLPGDLPDTFSYQTGGTFTLGNLAGLAPDPEVRRVELRKAGVRAGYFSNWREAVERPPFDPPADVSCQVIVFETSAQARTFLGEIPATEEGILSSAITWLPAHDRAVEELWPGSTAPVGARAFRLEGRDANADVTVYALVWANGPFVQSVYAGGEGSGDEALTAAVAAALFGRSVIEER